MRPARRLSTCDGAAPDYLYAVADIAGDFGPVEAMTLAVAQLSDAVGEGDERKAQVEIG